MEEEKEDTRAEKVWLTLRRNGRIFIDDLMRGIKMFGG